MIKLFSRQALSLFAHLPALAALGISLPVDRIQPVVHGIGATALALCTVGTPRVSR
jgi:hypothetical protein